MERPTLESWVFQVIVPQLTDLEKRALKMTVSRGSLVGSCFESDSGSKAERKATREVKVLN